MLKSGIVLDVQGKTAFLMTSNGIFTKVKIKGDTPSIGEIYSGKVLQSIKLLNFKINLKLVFLFLLMVLTAVGVFAYYIPANVVYLNVDSPIKITSNYFQIVTNYEASDATKEVINSTKIKNMPVSEALENIIDIYKKNNVINNQFINEKKSIVLNVRNISDNNIDLDNFKSAISTEKYNVNINYENKEFLTTDSTNYEKLVKSTPDNRISNSDQFKINMSENLNVDAIVKSHEYYKSSELASIMMMLKYEGVEKDETSILNELPKDTSPLVLSEKGSIKSFGDPHVGLVGDISNNVNPYIGIYPEALIDFFNKYSNNSCMDLTNSSLFDITNQIDSGNPVMVWATNNFIDPSNFYLTWTKNGKEISFPYDISNVIVLTGYDNEYIYYNDPSNESSNKGNKIEISKFKDIWEKCGSHALSYKMFKKDNNKIEDNSSTNSNKPFLIFNIIKEGLLFYILF